jgi:hypothetical protein
MRQFCSFLKVYLARDGAISSDKVKEALGCDVSK